MTTDFFLFAVFFCWVAWFVLYPLYRNVKTDLVMYMDDVPDTQRTLQQRRSELMLTLRDLDFDFETDVLSKEDYKALRDRYQQETIEVLRQIDAEKDKWEEFKKDLNQKLDKHEA